MEIWKDVVGFDGVYKVSNLGRVYSTLSNKVLKQMPRRHGYLSVWLYGKGGISGRNGKAYSVHRIVAEAFCEKRDGANEVNHLNEDKTDNRAENLEWCTHQENMTRGTVVKRISDANKNGKKAKPVYAYDKVTGEFVKSYPSIGEITRSTPYSVRNIGRCIAGKTPSAYGYIWKH